MEACMFLKRGWISLLLLLISLSLYSEKSKDILVPGFINQGDKSDNNINLVITKSLSLFLNKLSGIRVLPAMAPDKDPKINTYFKSKKLSSESLLDMGLSYQANIVIGGEYKVEGNSVKINVIAYNV